MKVMHFISGLQSGGVEQFLTNYTSKMNSQKADIEEYVIYQHQPVEESLRKMEEAGNKCIQIPDKRKHPWKNLTSSFKLIRTIRPDIVHTHMNLVNFFPLSVAWLLRVPVRISHSHIANNNIDRSVMIPIFKGFNGLFCNTRFACGNDAGKYMYGRKNFKIIPNSVNIDNFIFNESERVKLRKELNINPDTFVIGNIGRLTKQKNQRFLISQFSELLKARDDFKLIIVGTGELYEDLQGYISELNLEDKAMILKPVSDPSALYSMFDAFVLPSLYEGFPVVSIEAQISGLPVLMSDSIDKTAKLLNTTHFVGTNNNQEWNDCFSKLSKKNSRKVEKSTFDDFEINKASISLYQRYKALVRERSL